MGSKIHPTTIMTPMEKKLRSRWVLKLFPDIATISNMPCYLLAVHAGAGHYGGVRREEYTRLIASVLCSTAETLEWDARASDVVTSAVSALEDSPLTNAGVGSSLSESGDVECDASVCTADSVGSVGALQDIRNPCQVANTLRKLSHSPGLLGLVPPVFLTGAGAQRFAANECSMSVEAKCHVTSEAREKWNTYRSRLNAARKFASEDQGLSVVDTVGAVCLDVHGQLASAASSGGHWLKLSGRIGAAAVPNAGLCVLDDIAIASSGNGERLIASAFSFQCAMLLRSDSDKVPCTDGLTKRCDAGFIAIRRRSQGGRAEFMFSHATPSMSYGYYCPSSMTHPVCTVSTANRARRVVSGGYIVNLSDESC